LGTEDGEIASKVYSHNRSEDDANEIWDEVRRFFPSEQQTESVFMNIRQLRDLSESRKRQVKDEIFDQVVSGFLRFMWQNPYARGWVVKVASKRVGGFLLRNATQVAASLIDALPFTGDRSRAEEAGRKWEFDPLYNLFGQYLSYGDMAAYEYMKNNHADGRDRSNILMRLFEEAGASIKSAFDSVRDIGQKIIGATFGIASGLINFMRISMMQMTHGLSRASNMQAQTNALNRVFNDSIYYSAGTVDGEIVNPFLYFADNPFTREYGEPVVEIREPFQRLHTLGSFQHIIHNGIIENLADVATVVTATSNGQHPVTVHFDKGAPADRQMEKVVETGLFYDHPKGWLGMKKFLPTMESLRYWNMLSSPASMENTAKRVALWHLKQNLKNIYMGQVVVLGDASIRPHDMVYLGDVYERMYGLVEVSQVVHHFTPETGFVTSITPNAPVSINDPVRFSFISNIRGRNNVQNVRDSIRKKLQVTADSDIKSMDVNVPSDTDMTLRELEDSLDDQLVNTLQYTGGNSAIIKSIASLAAVGAAVRPDVERNLAIGVRVVSR
jgi:hypothetical protein